MTCEENPSVSMTSTEPAPEPAVQEKKPFCSLSESIFALVFCFTGYFFIKLFLQNECGIAASLFLLATLTASAVLAKLRKACGSRYSKLYFTLSAVFSLGIGISSSGTIRFMDFCFAALFFAMWAFALNNPEWQGFGRNTFNSVTEAVCGVSTRNFTACPKAAFSLFRRKSGAKNAGYVVIGLLLSVPVTIIVCVLLVSADDGFGDMLEKITGGISLDGFWTFIFGLPVSFLLFGIVYAAVSAKGKLRTDEVLFEERSERMRIAPSALICAFTAPLCVVYVLFFFSQLSYFISAFGGVLPEKFSASEYARRGFFELCAVAVINLLVIAAINVFCRRDDGKSAVLKVLTVIFSVFTLILIATAESKMFLYISRFGLTPKRVYTSWFMFILAVVFVLIMISRFKAFPAAKVGAAVITAAALLLGFCGADGLIARYDVSLIESGVMTEFPEDISADASLVIAGCTDSENTMLSHAAKNCRNELTDDILRKEWYERTLSDYIAIGAFTK